MYLDTLRLSCSERDEITDRIAVGEVEPDERNRCSHVDLLLGSGRRLTGCYPWDGDEWDWAEIESEEG